MQDEYESPSKTLEAPAQDLSTSSSSDNFQDPAKNADLFLKIAKDSAAAHHDGKENIPGSRRSRISLPFLTSSRPGTSMKSSPITNSFEAETARQRSEASHRFGKRSSIGPTVPGALTSTTYYTDARSQLGAPNDDQSVLDPSDSRSQVNFRSRRHSNAVAENSRPPTRSYQTRSRLASENLYADKLRLQEQTMTESTISTTAPSTVWDELDDLKSRIKKLELTGKIPSSSAAAMNERPRTATTQATTMSSSPKHKPSANSNALPSAIEGIPSTVHPTLHEALMNAKSSVSNDVYQKLQATAADALQLSTMLNHDYNASSPSGTLQSERQLRRRTESMCRSLTELTIALLAEQRNPAASPASRPGSRDVYQTPSSALPVRSRRLSNATNIETPEHRQPIPSRVASRLENRRTSLANSMAEPSPRPVSRAMTEAPTAYRGSSRATFSREYTRAHPLPSPATENSKVTTSTPQHQQLSSLVTRRQAAVNAANTPQAVNSSPIPFTISIERRQQFPDSPASVVSEVSPGPRSASGRRSLGFAARVSSVSSRLKAAREQRLAAARVEPAVSEVGGGGV